MSRAKPTLTSLTNHELEERVKSLISSSRRVIAELLEHLAEVDARRLYLAKACGSMHAYCTELLGLDDGAAYKRITAARVCRRYPRMLELLACGELHLTTITLLASKLDDSNHEELIELARGRRKRALERLLAARFPRPDAPQRIVRVPARSPLAPVVGSATDASNAPKADPRTSQAPAAPALADTGACAGGAPAPPTSPTPVLVLEAAADRPDRGRVTPLSAERYRIQFTASGDFVDKLREVQELSSHSVPDGSLETLMARALTLLLDDARRKRFGAKKKKSNKESQEAPSPEASGPRGQAETLAAQTRGTHRPAAGASERSPQSPQIHGSAACAAPPESADRSPCAGDAPAPRSKEAGRTRHIPSEVKRIVWERDGGRCTAVDPVTGQRCSERRYLHFDHRVEYAREGAHVPENIQLLCSGHNLQKARETFGDAWIESRRAAESQQGAA